MSPNQFSFFHLLFLFAAPSTSYIYPLSLHDALPIFLQSGFGDPGAGIAVGWQQACSREPGRECFGVGEQVGAELGLRSEEHTSELQSRGHLVCRLLLEKKK